MNRDTLVGLVGAALLTAAMVGVFVYEHSTVQALAGETGLGNFTAAGPRLSGTVGLGGSDSQVANITEPRASNVTFTLTWTAENGRDTLRITVTPPSGSGIAPGGLTATGDEGTLTVTALVPDDADSDGDWTVEVEFTDAEPDPLPGGISPPVPPPMSTDGSVGYAVAVTLDE